MRDHLSGCNYILMPRYFASIDLDISVVNGNGNPVLLPDGTTRRMRKAVEYGLTPIIASWETWTVSLTGIQITSPIICE